ncbi:MAG: FHA domain-containing protein [Proteobacteria bacterium]|nr:FHA domain-containing protein [Pseudomonadota bacterium]
MQTRSLFAVLAAIYALALALSSPAHAAPRKLSDPPWLRIDRVVAEPAVLQGYARLQLFVTPVNLQGQILDISGARAWTLVLGRQKKRIPYIAGTFRNLDIDVALAIVIETSAEFSGALPTVQREVTTLIDNLPRDTQVAIIGYDDSLHGSRRLRSRSRALKVLSGLEPSNDPGGPVLIKAIDRARRALARVKPDRPGVALRKLILVISDGKDIDPRPANYRKVSRRADREGIRIHSIAYPPDRNRLPLRGLAEMSKQSLGTFRFVRTKDSFKLHFEQLRKEIEGQYVLTYLVPRDDVVGKRVGLLVDKQQLESTDSVRISKLLCGAAECSGEHQYCAGDVCIDRFRDDGRGLMGWLLLIGSIAAGIVVLFVALSLLLGWAQRPRPDPPFGQPPFGQPEIAPPEPAPAAQASSSAPHRIVPQGPHGGAVAPSPPRGQIAPSGPTSAHHQALPGPPAAAPITPSGRAPSAPASAGHQVVQPTGPHGAPQAAPRVQPSLLVLKGPMQGQRMPIHHGFVIGTAPGCHLQLIGDNYASSHHAQILMDTAGGCTLVDQGSTNGTFINGVRTTQKRLFHGMLITIGNTEARFLAQ